MGNVSKRFSLTDSGRGFLSGTHVRYKAGIGTGNYHEQVNSINFETWMNEKVH
jgi:hypothetical protein